MANYTILLIDYEPRSIERFREPLVGAGYTVEIATDGLSGMEAFHRLNPDMVLVEAMIPKKHGFEVCQELKRTPHGQRTPVIITTGVYKGRKYRTQALHIYGCDEYIEKPIAPQQLLGLVGKFFDSASSPVSIKPTEAESDSSNSMNTPPAHRHGDADTNAASVSVPPSMANEDAEDEIMARLDAILPQGGNTPSSSIQQAKVAAATGAMLDPFSQMRAELDAELCVLPSEALFESTPDPGAPLPSDQAISATVLEALPFPEFQAPIPAAASASPAVADKPKGKVASAPEPKRGRNNKKHERQSKGRGAPLAAVPAAAAAPAVAATPRPVAAVELSAIVDAVEPALAAAPIAPVALVLASPSFGSVSPAMHAAVFPAVEETVPRGTMVESVLEPEPKRRGVPVWIFVAAGIVAIVAAAAGYVVFWQGGRDSASAVSSSVAATPVQETSPPLAKEQPLEAEPPPPAEPAVASAPPATPPQVVDPPKETSSIANAGVTTPKPAAPKKTNGRTLASATGSGTAKPLATPPATAAPAERAAEPPKSAEVAAPARVEPDAPVEHVEAVAKTTPSAPAQLIPIDQADTMPTPLSHRLPVFSDRAKQAGLSGTVVMNVLVSEHGTVDQVVLVTGIPGADIDETSLNAAKAWTYRPATKNGAPVKVWKSERVVVRP